MLAPQHIVTTSDKKTMADTTLPTLPQNIIIKTLRWLKRGTASGPFATSIDVFKDYALCTTTQETQTTYPYIDAFCSLITLIAQNNIPAAVKTCISAQYVVALHKDPQTLDKLRPIGIWTTLWRITAASLMPARNHNLQWPWFYMTFHLSTNWNIHAHTTTQLSCTTMPWYWK
jgi:hypothetical protein